MSDNSEAWHDPYGCRDVSLAEDYVAELEAELDRLERLRVQGSPPVKRFYAILHNLDIHYETQVTIVHAFCEAMRGESE